MFQPRLRVVLPAADRAHLTDVAASGKTPQKIAIRARLLVWLADQIGPADVARRLRISRNHVHYWVRRYVAQGVSGGLTDAPRPGRRTRLTAERIAAIVTATLTPPPGATHWSTRTMARAQGVSEKTIRNIWHQHGLQPHRTARFKLSTVHSSSPSCAMWWGSISIRRPRPWSFASTRRAAFRRSTAPSPCCRCVLGFPSARRMITAATAAQAQPRRIRQAASSRPRTFTPLFVEPVIGWIKVVLGFRRFSLRGMAKARGEWNLVCLAVNLKRWHRIGIA